MRKKVYQQNVAKLMSSPCDPCEITQFAADTQTEINGTSFLK